MAWGMLAVAGLVPDESGEDDLDLERPVVVVSVRQAKGLEFDTVIVADPAGIIADSDHGMNDLYAAITRATQRLGVVPEGVLPSALNRLRHFDESWE